MAWLVKILLSFPYPSITHHHHIMCFKSLPLLQQGQNIMLHVALSNHGKNNIGKAQGWPFKGSSKVAVQFYDFIADAVLQCIMHDSSLLWNVLTFLNKGWWPVSKLGSSKQPFFCGQSHSLNVVFISFVANIHSVCSIWDWHFSMLYSNFLVRSF